VASCVPVTESIIYFVRLIVFMHVYGCCGLIIICSQGSSA
jgi:hypothetical protein